MTGVAARCCSKVFCERLANAMCDVMMLRYAASRVPLYISLPILL